MTQACVGTMGSVGYFGQQGVVFPPIVGQIDCTRSRREALKVRQIIRTRRARTSFFNADLFADPAWDLLLELYASELTHRRMSVSDACIASAVPATTALRWIGALERAGLIERRNDPFDGRRIFVELSETASSAMGRLMATIPDGAAE